MNTLYANGRGYEGGGETGESLEDLARDLSDRIAGGDEALGKVVEAVEAQASATQAERTKPFTGDSPRVNLLLALRPMLRGEKPGTGNSPEVSPSTRPETRSSAATPASKVSRAAGHTILTSGGVVRGKILSGGYPGETAIQTSQGIVRARGSARLGNH